jgi:hypothetical protein
VDRRDEVAPPRIETEPLALELRGVLWGDDILRLGRRGREVLEDDLVRGRVRVRGRGRGRVRVRGRGRGRGRVRVIGVGLEVSRMTAMTRLSSTKAQKTWKERA